MQLIIALQKEIDMNRKINHAEQSPALFKKLLDLGMATHESSLPRNILDLVNIRASQMNGCSFCLDMHVKEAKIHGERELRLYHIPIFRESPLFSAKEKAILEWTEEVTKPSAHGISDEIFNRVREQLSEKEMSDLTYAIGVINFFNRLNISFPTVPGSLDQYFGLNKAGLN
jgi:AhpD family alkylhydroperoxidase